MPDISQYNFTLQEIGAALIKSAGISDGKWALGVNFTINAGNMGPTHGQAIPSVMVQVESLNLAKAPDNAPVGGTIFDASKLD